MQNVVVKDGIKLTGPSHAPPTREELSMDLKGEYRLPARREAVWAALNFSQRDKCLSAPIHGAGARV